MKTTPICEFLRWKGQHREAEAGEQRLGTLARNQVPYTCLKTCQPWGPDDQPAVPEGCDGSRSCCFEGPPLRDS